MILIGQMQDLAPYSEKFLAEKRRVEFSREQLDRFLALSGDANPIHDNGANPVIPANLLISIIPSFLQSYIKFADHVQCFTVGYRDVRFRRQIKLGDQVALSIKLKLVKNISAAAYVDYRFQFFDENKKIVSAQGVMSDLCVFGSPN